MSAHCLLLLALLLQLQPALCQQGECCRHPGDR
ncbi:hypothetical protein Nmel_011279, partial [Mimus melanotis]